MAWLGLTIGLVLSSSLWAEVVINQLAYDKVTDDVVIDTRFPGKCLPHEFKFIKTKSKGSKSYFRLEVSNLDDPCNALVEKRAYLRVAAITNRPAEILISTQADDSKPHAIAIPPHPKAQILKVRATGNGSLSCTIKFRGPFATDRFYGEVDAHTHEGIVRDKQGFQFAEAKLVTKEIILKLDQARRQTLVFYNYKGQPLRVNVP